MSDTPGRRRLVTLDEAAEYLAISRETFRALISEGEIPAYRLGRRSIRVDLDEVDASLRPVEVDSSDLGSAVSAEGLPPVRSAPKEPVISSRRITEGGR